jgi:hypothetical protein
MGRWVQRDAQAWWAIVQRQMESGLSQVAFCAAEELSVSSLRIEDWAPSAETCPSRHCERKVSKWLCTTR